MNERDLQESSGYGDEGLDPQLLRRFDAAAQAGLSDLDLLLAVESRIRGERRFRALVTGAFYVALVAVAILLTPYVAEASLTLAEAMGGWAPLVGPMLLTPVGFGLSLLGGGWLLRRVGVFAR
ncbi:MAG TPA: hypothetical protein VGM84_24015 [Steroidobacteraceae bacterium]|jgi:hypothetical protein